MRSLSTFFSRLIVAAVALSFFSAKATAQYIVRSSNPTFKTVYLDTIHLRGVVLDDSGKPIPDMDVGSLSYYNANGRNLHTKTDSSGKFIMNGTNPNDTLVISGDGHYTTRFYNRGSRYMEITLPMIKPDAINSEATPVVIQAKAASERKKLKLTYEEITCLDCGPGPMAEYAAEFPGGNDKFMTFIKRQLVYPEQAIKNNIQGLVKVNFWIEKDGTVVRPHVVQGIGYGCDEQVVRLINKSPKWKPASTFSVVPESIVVEFKLTDK